MKVKELVTKDFYIFDPEAPFKKVVEDFIARKLNFGLVVTLQNEVAGIITSSDLFNAAFPDYNEIQEHGEYIFDLKSIDERNKNLYDKPIKEIMTKNPEFVNANQSVVDAAAMMKSFRVKQLLVIENGAFIGILKIQDLISRFILHSLTD
jgi:CBS domain-containing protein